MQFILRYTAFVFVFVFSGLDLIAQSLGNYENPVIADSPVKVPPKNSFARTWEAGGMVGPDFYYGDLNSEKFLPNHSVSVAGGVYIMRQFTNAIGVKGQLLFGGLNGSKDGLEGSIPVNWSFNGVFFDFTVNSVFNFSNIVSPYREGRKFFVYGTVGAGISSWNTSLAKNVNGELIIPPQNSGFQTAFVLPLGLGAQYAFTNKISAGVEYTVRMVFSDYVDQTSGGFKNDFVNLLAFSVSYRFGFSKKNLNVQDYNYTGPVRYKPVTPVALPPPAKPESVIQTPPQTYSQEVYCYVVQVCAFSKHNYSVSWVKRHYRIDMLVVKETVKGLNRYIIGHFYNDIDVAKRLCDKLRKQGISDAWVIAYKGGVRHHVVIY